MTVWRRRALCAAGLAGLLAACKDIPLLPRWDADWYVPVPSQGIRLSNVFPVSTVPAATSAKDSFLLQQDLGKSVGELLGQTIRQASVIVTLSKTLALTVADTIFLAPNTASLGSAGSQRVDVPVSMSAAAQSVTDTVPMDSTHIHMLQSVADANGTLQVMLRGRVTNPGPGSVTVTSNDSIAVRLALLARVAISR